MPRSGVRSLLSVMEKARMVAITQKACRVGIQENSGWHWGGGPSTHEHRGAAAKTLKRSSGVSPPVADERGSGVTRRGAEAI